LPQALRTSPDVVAAYARRAAALRWDEAATRSIEQALDAQWSEPLADLYGELPVSRHEHRRAQIERWLSAHPSSPALLLAAARIAQAQGQWPQADSWLHRAIAQGAGAPAWEALGEGALNAGDETRARLAYANALRSQRGDTLLDLPGRDLRQQIADTAAIEVAGSGMMNRMRAAPAVVGRQREHANDAADPVIRQTAGKKSAMTAIVLDHEQAHEKARCRYGDKQ
jgi:HemY protein